MKALYVVAGAVIVLMIIGTLSNLLKSGDCERDGGIPVVTRTGHLVCIDRNSVIVLPR